jgi:hypothetical protein
VKEFENQMTVSNPTQLNIEPMAGMSTFAKLSKLAYSTIPHKDIAELFPNNGLRIDDHYSGIDMLTIVDSLNDVLYIIFRGTDISNQTGNRLRDIIDDLGVVINDPKYVHRLERLRDVTIQAINAHPDINRVFISGHSLGGFIGTEIMNNDGLYKTFPNKEIEGVFFNIGSSPLNKTKHTNKHIIHYTTNNPSVSTVLLDAYRHIMVPPSQSNTHSLENFL